MRVFHGSDILIRDIDLAKSGRIKDFGPGFYVTTIQKHAIQRAVETAEMHGTKPVVTEYEYSENFALNAKMSIKKFENIDKEWAEFIILNRNKDIVQPAHNFDIIEGAIADDWISKQILRYQKGKISMDELIKKLTFKEPTYQICFCTPESLYALETVENAEFVFAIV